MLKKRDTKEVSVQKLNLKFQVQKRKILLKKIFKKTLKKITNKSGVVLKPLSKDEQKRILKADSKKEKKDEIDKIRSGKSPNQLRKTKSLLRRK